MKDKTVMPSSPARPASPIVPANSSEQLPLFNDETAGAAESGAASAPKGRFSNFIVYVDESGDHGMQTVDPDYPIFVLAFCVFYKRHYCEKVVPSLQKFKFNHFGHDYVVLHEHEIRKERGRFRFQSRQHKTDFQNQLTGIIEANNFILISCVIEKLRLQKKQDTAANPYHLALGFCLETLHEFLQEKNQDDALTHVVVECRGNKEDRDLELEFRRICDGANRLDRPLPFEVVFVDKKANSSGLQLADLVARPVGLNILRPGQANRAFESLKPKFYCSGGRSSVGAGYENWGLKVYPAPESEKPR
ncbi:MAG: DUF3800 domain-containing protein [Porticoccaceae bacterium]